MDREVAIGDCGGVPHPQYLAFRHIYLTKIALVLLKIFPFSTAIFTDIALKKSRILFLIQWGVFEPPEALPIHTLSKLHHLIHELYLTNNLSFPELLNCGTHCHPLLSLNPTICHLLNLTSTNLILSPFLLKLPLIFSVFPLSGLCYRPYGLSPALLIKKNERKVLFVGKLGLGTPPTIFSNFTPVFGREKTGSLTCTRLIRIIPVATYLCSYPNHSLGLFACGRL